MKVIIAGSRTIHDMQLIECAIAQSGYNITEVVCGCAPGVDLLGAEWARDHDIPTAMFPADWDRFGRAAGPIRNLEMAKYADALILVWDGKSLGSKNMLRTAEDLDLRYYVHITHG